MNLCGEFITHKAFGKGKIVDFENSCVTVVFQDTNEEKKFVYPDAFGKFLVLENKKLATQVENCQNEIAQSIADAQKEYEVKRTLEKQEKAKSVKKTKYKKRK